MSEGEPADEPVGEQYEQGEKDEEDAQAELPEPPPQTPLFYALERPRYVRQDQIRMIEEVTGRRLIAYVGGPLTSIAAFDIPPFVDLMHDVEQSSPLDLMLHTPGGDVDQAERIVLMCRKRVGDSKFRVIVPDSAKSAGTLIAIAADEIVMGEWSELGPIDPQVQVMTASGEPMARPAQSFLDGLDSIVQDASKGELSPAYFPLLDKLDPALIDFCRKAIARSQKFAEKFLAAHMLRDDPDKAKEIAEELGNARKHLSHGAVIDADRALEMGLNVNVLDHDNPLWEAYWRLYAEMRIALDTNDRRLFEGRKTSLLV